MSMNARLKPATIGCGRLVEVHTMTNSAYLDLPLRSLPRAIADRALAARDDVLGEAFSLCQIAGHADLFREVTEILTPGQIGVADED